LYAFVGNNAANKSDPLGLYEGDVHYGITGYLASQAGFDQSEARGIADADQGVDDNDETSPLKLAQRGDWETHKRYHMPLNEIPGKYPRVVVPDTIFANEMTRAATDIRGLGQGLHRLQDSFAHKGAYEGNLYDQQSQSFSYRTQLFVVVAFRQARRTKVGLSHPWDPSIGGHGLSHAADQTYKRPVLAVEAARASYFELLGYRYRKGEIDIDEYERKVMNWNQMEPIVDLFARARSMATKMKWFRLYYPAFANQSDFARMKSSLPYHIPASASDPLSVMSEW
jgi:hypothetical protein